MAKLICTLEMSKERGVTITVDNADAKIVQTIAMNGTSLVLKVKGEREETSVTQTSEKVTIDCKRFEVNARDSITCTAAKTATYASQSGDTTVRSGGRLAAEAKRDVAVSGADVALTANGAASLKGLTVEAAGTQSLKLTGKAQAQLSGLEVTIKADAKLALDSAAMAGLKGSMTTIGGSLIKAG